MFKEFLVALLILFFGFGAAMLLPITKHGSALSPITSAWAAPTCDADGDSYFKSSRKCGGDDPDDSDPCIVPDGYSPSPELCNDGGGDGGDTNISAKNTEASWSIDLHSIKRSCTTHYLNLANGTVNYECGHGPANPEVVLGFSLGDFLPSGRYPELCDMLSEGLVFGPTDESNRVSAFIFSSGPEWNGDACQDDGSGTSKCRIWVRNTAYGKLCTQLERDTDKCGDRLIVMTGYGLANAAPVLDGVAELNPFTVKQDIALNELTFDIKGIGKNRTDATCTADFDRVDVEFHTNPVP